MKVVYVWFKSVNEELFDNDERELMEYLRRKVREGRDVSIRLMSDGLSIIFVGESYTYMVSMDGESEYNVYKELLRSIMM
jgi:hypothetical protein